MAKKAKKDENKPLNSNDLFNISIAWCDGGMTDGKFTEGILNTTIKAPAYGFYVRESIRVHGNQIGRQRQALFDHWLDHMTSDWILWVDSDICINPRVVKMLIDTADEKEKPVVTGTYFVNLSPESGKTGIAPALFNNISQYSMAQVHPLPDNQVIQVDNAGFGFVLMHKSVGLKMREMFPGESVFEEEKGIGEKYVSEDIVFFRRMKKCGIPLYAHTGALVQHMKRYPFDIDLYTMYWTSPIVKDKKVTEDKVKSNSDE
jgi:GT2 family glycosyltransferase